MKTTILVKERELALACNAFTPILYRNLFHRDFMKDTQYFTKYKGIENSKLSTDDQLDIIEQSECYARFAFVCAKQAEVEKAADLMKLSLDDYYEWLCGFEPNSFVNKDIMLQLMGLWQGNVGDSTVEAKN